MAAILGVERTFYPEVALESEDITKSRTSFMFCTYDWLPSLDINEVTPVENFDSILKNGDAINEATNNIFCRHGHVAMAHLHIKFDDHTLNRFRVIAKNVPISFKHEYRRPTLSSSVTSSETSSA